MLDTNDCNLKTRRSPLSIGRPMRWLLTLFVGVYSVWVGTVAIRARHQQRIVERLESIGAAVEYDKRPCSILIKCLIGDDAYNQVTVVGLNPAEPLHEDDLTLLADLPGIRQVYLSGDHITDEALQSVAELPGLVVLGLRSPRVTARGFAQFDGNDSLETLYVGGATVTDDMLKSVSTLGNLHTLGFIECRFQSADFGSLASLPHLSELAIMDSAVNEGIRNLDRIHALENLVLFHVPFTDDDCEQLSGLSRLKKLRVNCASTSDAGLRHLAELHSLEYLHLQDEAITDDGLVFLRGLENLSWLDLSYTQVSDAGLKQIASIRSLSNVSLSHLSGDHDIRQTG